jgi:ABC-type uncharacterized transport system ATPase subunit
MVLLAEKVIKEFGFDPDANAHYISLTMSEKLVVEFLRCIYRNPKLLIIDEALAKLNGSPLDRVIEILKEKTA